MRSQHPAWLVEPCPQWCSVNHNEQTLAPDRRHESHVMVVSAVSRHRRRSADGTIGHVVVAEELDVLLFRDIGEGTSSETWLGIASNADSIELTLESAQRLVVVLGQILTEAIGRER